MLAKMFEVAVLSRSITIKYEVGPAKMRRLMSLYTGWWLSHPSEKYEFVSWDDDIPNIWKVIKVMFQTTNQWCYELSFMSFLCWKNAIDLISGFVRENWISEHVAIQITHLSFRNRGWILSRSLMSVSKVFRLSKRWNSPVRQNSRITEAKPFTSYAYRWWYFYGLSFHKWGDLLTSSWLVVYLPLRKIWVRQLGLMTFPIYGKS